MIVKGTPHPGTLEIRCDEEPLEFCGPFPLPLPPTEADESRSVHRKLKSGTQFFDRFQPEPL
jgi:hypothetical protein